MGCKAEHQTSQIQVWPSVGVKFPGMLGRMCRLVSFHCFVSLIPQLLGICTLDHQEARERRLLGESVRAASLVSVMVGVDGEHGGDTAWVGKHFGQIFSSPCPTHAWLGCWLVGLDLFNNDTRRSGHISRPTQVNVSQSWFHSLNNYSSTIILSSAGASWS